MLEKPVFLFGLLLKIDNQVRTSNEHCPEHATKSETEQALGEISTELSLALWKTDGRKMNFLLGWPIFRGYVSFMEGI